jgi:hypothetical protein
MRYHWKRLCYQAAFAASLLKKCPYFWQYDHCACDWSPALTANYSAVLQELGQGDLIFPRLQSDSKKMI